MGRKVARVRTLLPRGQKSGGRGRAPAKPDTKLKEYRRKRHFARTPEPAGRGTKAGVGIFVIHKHSATRLHYDLRLELEGTLKSWAVPKGPSLDPADKRLAVQVEDHPVEYASFEGVIPAGEYGAGPVMIWDRGTWDAAGSGSESFAHGRLKFTLHGEKLKGGWTLVRMGGRAGGEGKNWLLIKERDSEARLAGEYDIGEREPLSVASGRSMEEIRGVAENGHSKTAGARQTARSRTKTGRAARPAAKTKLEPGALPGARRSPQPDFLAPQLATPARSVPDGDDWVHEIKFDGYRIACLVKAGRARLLSRRGHDWSGKFPTVARLAVALPVEQAILDGEVVALKADGTTDFQALQNALRDRSEAGLVYYIFDLPHCAGYDLTHTPLLARKELLQRLLAGVGATSRLQYSEHIQGHGPDVFDDACRFGMEGIISKRAASPYVSKRVADWLKIKCAARQEFVIGGFTDPAGARSAFGALLLGYYAGDRLIFCGRVGTGFDERALKSILRELKARETSTTPFDNPPTGAAARGVHWVRPELVGEVRFRDWTNEGILRQPSFQGLRMDKEPREVVREEPQPAPTNGRARTRPQAKDRFAGVELTNPERVLYPEQQVTKRMLAAFYQEIADWVLPHVVDRPLALLRCPQGHQAKCFFQKHVTEQLGAPIRGIPLREDGQEVMHIAIRNLAGLITLVQLGALELHPWGSRADDVERPDRMFFDLDPGEGVPWTDVITAARRVRDRLAGLGLRSFVKTSGGKGLHVVVPLVRRTGWDELKDFSHALAQSLVREAPRQYLATMSKARRAGKIFVDWLRNRRGATCIAAYSTRARSGAPVSVPLEWDELDKGLGPTAFTVENLPQRLRRRKRDPWAGFFEVRQSLPRLK